MTFVYILLFLVCLSTLIMVHEAGHLVTAKIFKVYCFEYALGFGPRLFSFRRKNGETRFSVRAIPFGGFVSMYGEADAVPQEYAGMEINPSRSINNIKHWKRAIIMTAGIMMNFVLALLVFFIYEMAFPAYTPRTAHVTIATDSIAYEAGLRSGDTLRTTRLYSTSGSYIIYDDDALIHYLSEEDQHVFFGYHYNQMTIKNQDVSNKAVAFKRVNLGEITSSAPTLSFTQFFNEEYVIETEEYSINGYLYLYAVESDYTVYFKMVENPLTDTNSYGQPLEDKSIIFSLKTNKETFEKQIYYIPDGAHVDLVGSVTSKTILGQSEPTILFKSVEYETAYADISKDNLLVQSNYQPQTLEFDADIVEAGDGDASRLGVHHISVKINSGTLVGLDDKQPLGIAMQLDEYWNSYGEGVKNTFKDFGRSTTLIFRGLGQLFTPEGFKNVGGIIAIGVVTTQTLEQNGFGNFLFLWAMISVNLGIVNLLPFPGLDGWQFLVTIVEGVAHKEIPPKVKNTVSAIGIMLLFVLMIMIVVKDLIMVV